MSAYSLLLRATIAHSFGSGGQRPFQTALWRLGGLAAGAMGFAWLLGRSLQSMPAVPLPQPELLAISVAIAVQVAVAFALVVASGAIKSGQREVFAKLLLVWPLGPGRRWVLFMLPSLILGLLTVALMLWPLAILASRLGLTWALLAPAIGIGYASAFGLVRTPARRFPRLVILWLPGVLWAEYELVRRINDIAQPLDDRIVYAAVAELLLALLVIVAIAGKDALRSFVASASHAQLVRRPVAPRWWYLAKLARRPSFGLSLGVVVALSLMVALASRRLYYLQDPEIFSFLAALLVAAVTTDLRATARRHNPAEITALRGTGRFMLVVTLSALAIGVTVVLPVVAGAWELLRVQPPEALWHFALQPLIGSAAGLLAGIVFIPQGRDISSQFVATLLVLAILFGAPQLPGLSHLDIWQRNLIDALICLSLLACAWGVEQKRNPYKWRISNAK